MDATTKTRRIARLAVSMGLATVAVTATAAPMLAADAPYYGYTVDISASVACDAATGTMSVTPSGSTFRAQGFLGPILGIYDAGQSVRYNVFTREVGAAGWTQAFDWSAWETIVSMQDPGTGMVIFVPQQLGTSSVPGSAGRNYEILVQVDYWAGQENIYNVTPTYSQTLSTGVADYYLNPGYCHL